MSEKSIAEEDSWLYIDREATRVSAEALKVLDNKDVLLRFPKLLFGSQTELVLKTPKTRSSVRKVWIPKTVAELLLRYREWQQKQIRIFEEADEPYQDFGLVLTERTGRPFYSYDKLFKRLVEKAELPDVVFHSLRHSSTTYKLKLTGGDIKATQGDTGHAQVEMVTKVYSHILDEDRKVNAQKFEEAFYQPQANSTLDPDTLLLIEAMGRNSELMALVKNLLTNQNS